MFIYIQTSEEIWRYIFIKNEKTHFIVSNRGNIKNTINNKFLHPSKDSKGYLRVCLRFNKKSNNLKVHRLVCLAFLNNPLNKPQVNHKDGNKINNDIRNLEWATNGENGKHAYQMNLKRVLRGEENPTNKYTTQQILNVKSLINKGLRNFEISKITGLPHFIVSAVRRKYLWKHLNDV